MTVITKPLSENKSKNLNEPLFSDKNSAGVENVDEESGVDPRFVILYPGNHKFSTVIKKSLSVLTLVILAIGIIGVIYLSRELFRPQMHFHGWCTIPYNVDSNQARTEVLISDSDFDASNYIENGEINPDAETFDPRNFLRQEFEIDFNNEGFEKIIVHNFRRGRKGLFIHDFGSNKTGIIDIKGQRCFVMPLDRQRVFPLPSMYHLIQKISCGYYKIDTEIVREMLRAVTPPITDFKAVGEYITEECANFHTYLLERLDVERLAKRSLPTSEAIFAEFAGNKISELFIDTSALDDF